MAQVQSNDGLPSVSPQASAPDDRQRIQSSPADFGAGVAQAGQRLGAAATGLGKTFGEVQTDDAINGAMDTVNQHLSSYRSLNGRDALDAREDTEKAIDEAFKAGRDGLHSMDQQMRYDTTVRSYRERYVSGIIASHADQQAKTYASQTNKAALDVAMGNIANVADDDVAVLPFIHDARSAAVKQVQLEGNGHDPNAVDDAINRADRAAYKTQAETVAIKDPSRALEIIGKHKDVLGLEYPELEARFRTRANEQNALGIVDSAFSGVASNLANPKEQSTSGVRQAIFDQESGNKSTAPKSANGAIGPGQVMPATFKQYAKPGEDINNPDDNRAVAGRVIDDLSQKFDGDPARIAVGYFSGPGNVAPAGSPQPWIADTKDANGKSVSSYVGDITSRVSTQGQQLAAKANIYDKVLDATAGNPVLRQAALREVNQRYSAAETAALTTEKALKDHRDTALRSYGDSIRSGNPEQPWRKDPYLSEEQVEHLDTLQRQTLQEGINGRPGDYGPGYANAVARIFGNGSDRIVNQEQLLPLVGANGLNPAGYEAASKQLEAVNKPGAEADRVLQGNFYAAARHAVTLEYEGAHDIIPGAGAKWNEALPALNQALAAGRAKGLTNQQLMDPANKDSVWGVLKPWLPNANEKMVAEMKKDAKGAAAFDVATIKTLDDLTKAYGEHNVTKEQAATIVRAHPDWNVTFAAPTTTAGPQVPVER